MAQGVYKGIVLLIHDRGTRRGEWSAACPGPTLPRERHGTHFTGGWVDHRSGLERCGKSRLHRDLIPDRPARIHSLYIRRYSAYTLYNTRYKLQLISRPDVHNLPSLWLIH